MEGVYWALSDPAFLEAELNLWITQKGAEEQPE
jgi:hypothetical protein